MSITGYNLVRGRAVEEFRAAFAHRFELPEPETVSVLSLLRHIQRQQPFPHKVIQVTGFPDLWRVCPDADKLARMLFRLFFEQMNWLQNQNPYIYFLVPEQVAFNYGEHLYLRLSADLYADMTAVFGHMRQIVRSLPPQLYGEPGVKDSDEQRRTEPDVAMGSVVPSLLRAPKVRSLWIAAQTTQRNYTTSPSSVTSFAMSSLPTTCGAFARIAPSFVSCRLFRPRIQLFEDD